MADMDFGWAINDGDVTDALDRVGRKAAGTGGFVEKEFDKAGRKLTKTFFGFENIARASFAGVAAAVGLSAKALHDYGQVNDTVQGQLDSAGRAASEVWKSIGREISSLADAALPAIIDGLKEFKGIWESFQDFMAVDVFGADPGDVAMIREAKKEQERQTREKKSREAADAMVAPFRAQEATLRNNPILADAIDAERMMRETMQKLNADTTMLPEDKQRVLDAMSAMLAARAADVAIQEDAKQREADKKIDEMFRKQRDRVESVDDAAERLRIENLRMAGLATEADRLQAQLDLKKQIRDIERDQDLTRPQKEQAIARLNDLYGQQLAIIDAQNQIKPGSSRVIAGGLLNSATVERLVLGGGRPDTAKEAARVARESLNVLKKIDSGISNLNLGLA